MTTYSSNLRSLRALAALDRASSAQGRATERLSSGQRINRASDDAAGLAVASSLKTNSRVYTAGIRNLNDGLSALNVADGGLSQLSTLVTRMKELAEQSANGSLDFTQRNSLNDEATALTSEFNRTLATVSFNGISLIDLTQRYLRLQGGYGVNGGIGVSLGDELGRTTGDGTFQSRVGIAAVNNPTGTRSADLDGDGDLDLIYGVNTAGSLGVALNNGDGTFAAQTTYTGAGGVAGCAIGDLNGDGILDAIVSATATEEAWAFYGNGDGTFGAATDLGFAIGSAKVDVGDFNGDGQVDIVGIVTGYMRVALSDGSGGFSSPYDIQISGGSSARQIAILDFDHDGNLDMVASLGSTSVNIFRGDGSGNFARSVVTVAGNATGISVGDFDGDGRNDFAVSYNTGGANGQVQTYLQQSDGSFTLGQTFGSSVLGQQLSIGDFNGDGVPDLVASNTTNSSVLVLMGRGDGTFTSQTLVAGGGTNHFTLGDFNGDGADDIIVRDSATSFGLFKGRARETATLQRLSLFDQAQARSTLETLEGVLGRILRERGALGATASRVETALGVLRASADNSEAAASRITDADMAEETSASIRSRILQDVATAVLAQANQQPALALQLLKI